MRKVYLKFNGEVILNVEDNEELSDVWAELDICHPDNTRVVDFKMENFEVVDSK